MITSRERINLALLLLSQDGGGLGRERQEDQGIGPLQVVGRSTRPAAWKLLFLTCLITYTYPPQLPLATRVQRD